MKYAIYQNSLRDIGDDINRLGWDNAADKYSKVRAHLDCSLLGSERFKPEYFAEYKLVAYIEAEGLEDVFHVGNMGPESAIERHAPMHSLSVGDIVVDPDDGEAFMVNGCGFGDIELPEAA